MPPPLLMQGEAKEIEVDGVPAPEIRHDRLFPLNVLAQLPLSLILPS